MSIYYDKLMYQLPIYDNPETPKVINADGKMDIIKLENGRVFVPTFPQTLKLWSEIMDVIDYETNIGRSVIIVNRIIDSDVCIGLLTFKEYRD